MGDRQEETQVVRIAVVEDHGVVREGLCALLATWSEAEVVWNADSGEEALVRAISDPPDLFLMDISLPGISGIEATRAVKAQDPNSRVLMLTVHDSDQHIHAAFMAGADGYVLKDAPAPELRAAVGRVAAGEPQMPPRATGPRSMGKPRETGDSPWGDLTPREKEVLTWVGRGETSKQIALRLEISPRTVEKHRANIMEKLGVHSGTALAAAAVQHGLV